MMAVENFWDRRNRMPVLTASAGMVAVIALADWWTPSYVSLGLLYLFPIMLAAGFLPRFALVLAGIVCAGLSEAFSSLGPEGRGVRLLFETLALAGCGLFVSELLTNRRLNLETQQRLIALVETSPAAIITVDEHGVISRANRAAAELLLPPGPNLTGQPISSFLPELQSALCPGGGTQFRSSMQCDMHRGDGEILAAEVWFSTYTEKGVLRLAAIIADVSEDQSAGGPSDSARPDGSQPPTLNSRQIAVLRLILEGLSNSQIALRLDVTPSAVKHTLEQLFSKAGVNNRSQMVRVALERYRSLL